MGRARPRRIPESAEKTFVAEPELPESATPSALDADVRRDLRGLQKDTAEKVAQHLVAAGQLVDSDPEQALQHARYARRRAARIAVVREAAGIVAYHAGEWNEALGEFRAARRMGGGNGHVPVMADIERALGRPERALDLTRGPEARDLGRADRIELTIVAAGARRDLGEAGAAVVALQVPELDPARRDPWSARLFYAYADNLLAADRTSEAVQWFVHAYDADAEQETDAAARIAELTGDLPPGAPLDEDDFAVGVEDVPDDTQVGGSSVAGNDAAVEEVTDARSVVGDADAEPDADADAGGVDGAGDAESDAADQVADADRVAGADEVAESIGDAGPGAEVADADGTAGDEPATEARAVGEAPDAHVPEEPDAAPAAGTTASDGADTGAATHAPDGGTGAGGITPSGGDAADPEERGGR